MLYDLTSPTSNMMNARIIIQQASSTSSLSMRLTLALIGIIRMVAYQCGSTLISTWFLRTINATIRRTIPPRIWIYWSIYMSSNKRLDVMLLLLKGLYPVSLVYPNDHDAFDLTTDVDTIKIQEFLFVDVDG